MRTQQRERETYSAPWKDIGQVLVQFCSLFFMALQYALLVALALLVIVITFFELLLGMGVLFILKAETEVLALRELWGEAEDEQMDKEREKVISRTQAKKKGVSEEIEG